MGRYHQVVPVDSNPTRLLRILDSPAVYSDNSTCKNKTTPPDIVKHLLTISSLDNTFLHSFKPIRLPFKYSEQLSQLLVFKCPLERQSFSIHLLSSFGLREGSHTHAFGLLMGLETARAELDDPSHSPSFTALFV